MDFVGLSSKSLSRPLFWKINPPLFGWTRLDVQSADNAGVATLYNYTKKYMYDVYWIHYVYATRARRVGERERELANQVLIKVLWTIKPPNKV